MNPGHQTAQAFPQPSQGTIRDALTSVAQQEAKSQSGLLAQATVVRSSPPLQVSGQPAADTFSYVWDQLSAAVTRASTFAQRHVAFAVSSFERGVFIRQDPEVTARAELERAIYDTMTRPESADLAERLVDLSAKALALAAICSAPRS